MFTTVERVTTPRIVDANLTKPKLPKVKVLVFVHTLRCVRRSLPRVRAYCFVGVDDA